jgi:hypothetical protein
MSQRPTAVRRTRLVLCALVFSVVTCGCDSGSGSAAGGLSDQDRAVATSIARHEASRSARSVSIATATLGTGTVTDSNTGHRCTSGKLLRIKVTGQWNIAHGVAGPLLQPTSPAASVASMQTVILQADPTTGFACLISFSPQVQPPDRAATVLFKNWHP